MLDVLNVATAHKVAQNTRQRQAVCTAAQLAYSVIINDNGPDWMRIRDDSVKTPAQYQIRRVNGDLSLPFLINLAYDRDLRGTSRRQHMSQSSE
jgi:hypothetical protein